MMDIMQNDIAEIKTAFIKLESKLERLEIEFHKMDIRINTLEHKKV